MASYGAATMAAKEPMLSAVHAGTPILQIRDLRTDLLKLASLSLSAGECIAVQGPSGAGKTLLLRAIAALDPVSVAAVESLIATRVRAGLAVLWVTHDAEQAKRIARRLLVVKGGQVREKVPEWQTTSP